MSGQGLDSLSEAESQGQAGHAGLLAAIEGQAPQAAKAFVEDILSIAGIARVGGRSAGEIAERFLARASNRTGLPDESRLVIERYLAISGDPDQAALRHRGSRAGGGPRPRARPCAAFEERTGFMAARGLDVERFAFSAAFARNLDYYTGFIFEVQDPRRSDRKPIVGGGRYDGLLQHLGAKDPDRGRRLLVLARPDRGKSPMTEFPSHSGRSLEGAPAGERGGVLRPRRAWSSRSLAARSIIAGTLKGVPDVEVAFVSASEIVNQLATGVGPSRHHRRGPHPRADRRCG